jgi:hypothetical protein
MKRHPYTAITAGQLVGFFPSREVALDNARLAAHRRNIKGPIKIVFESERSTRTVHEE